MTDSQLSSGFKMAAIDLDGTLLAADGTIRPANQHAVKRLQQAGLQVVLASGRHYNSMLRYAEELPGIQWLVSSQGGEAADLRRTVVLASESLLPSARVAEMVRSGSAQGFSPVAFSVKGVFTTATSHHNPDLEFFSELDGHPPIRCELEQLLTQDIFKVIWVGNPKAIDQNLLRCPVDLSGIQMVRTDLRFLEFMPATMSKASALKTLAARLGIQASETIAFGDGDNDVPMFQWAGLSVAMPHGWPAAIRAASHTAPMGPADTALARGVDFLFERGFLRDTNAYRPQPALAATFQ
jgi:Cof subfamily protein (haloacid dehalogenase superfamily)